MLDSNLLSTTEYIKAKRVRSNLLLFCMIASLIVILGTSALLFFMDPHITVSGVFAFALAVFAIITIPVIIWNFPRFGIYFLIVSAIIFAEPATTTLSTVPTSVIKLWINFSTIGQMHGTNALKPLSFSPAEIVMILTTLAWLIRSISDRTFKFRPGAFIWPILIYLSFVLWGYVHGLTTGGDRVMALYEVRAQTYLLLATILGANLITEVKHVKAVLWSLLIGSGILSVFGTITYFVVGTAASDQSLLAHDDTLFFVRLVLLSFIVMMINVDKKMRAWAIFFLPFAIISIIGNQRRASIAAFIIAFIPLLPLLWVNFKDSRKQIGIFLIVFSVLSAVYLPVAWNAKGAWALPARAIRSQSDPNARDESSDFYRMAESADLRFTRDTNPWLGYGYGKEFIEVVPLVRLTTSFLDYLPHNGVLWVWMRLGNFGFLAFLMIIVFVLIRGPQLLSSVSDPYLKTIGILAILDILMIYIYGKYDLQITNPRQMFILSIQLGILSALPYISNNQSSFNSDKVKLNASKENR